MITPPCTLPPMLASVTSISCVRVTCESRTGFGCSVPFHGVILEARTGRPVASRVPTLPPPSWSQRSSAVAACHRFRPRVAPPARPRPHAVDPATPSAAALAAPRAAPARTRATWRRATCPSRPWSLRARTVDGSWYADHRRGRRRSWWPTPTRPPIRSARRGGSSCGAASPDAPAWRAVYGAGAPRGRGRAVDRGGAEADVTGDGSPDALVIEVDGRQRRLRHVARDRPGGGHAGVGDGRLCDAQVRALAPRRWA